MVLNKQDLMNIAGLLERVPTNGIREAQVLLQTAIKVQEEIKSMDNGPEIKKVEDGQGTPENADKS